MIFKKRRVVDEPVIDTPRPVKSKEQIDEERWERRRWELVRSLVIQDRRSVILGKLRSTPQMIANNARKLADATINEMRNTKTEGNEREK